MVGEHERLEEPRDVRAVPLRRGDVRHGLDGLVLGGERRGERLGVGSHLVVACDERVGVPESGRAWVTSSVRPLRRSPTGRCIDPRHTR